MVVPFDEGECIRSLIQVPSTFSSQCLKKSTLLNLGRVSTLASTISVGSLPSELTPPHQEEKLINNKPSSKKRQREISEEQNNNNNNNNKRQRGDFHLHLVISDNATIISGEIKIKCHLRCFPQKRLTTTRVASCGGITQQRLETVIEKFSNINISKTVQPLINT